MSLRRVVKLSVHQISFTFPSDDNLLFPSYITCQGDPSSQLNEHPPNFLQGRQHCAILAYCYNTSQQPHLSSDALCLSFKLPRVSSLSLSLIPLVFSPSSSSTSNSCASPCTQHFFFRVLISPENTYSYSTSLLLRKKKACTNSS